jgi:hypothetical protein
MHTSGETTINHPRREARSRLADQKQWHERGSAHRRQRTKLHHRNFLGVVLHIHDSSLLLHDTLSGQHRASRLGDWLGTVYFRSRLGSERRNSVRNALSHWSIRMLLVHGNYICDWLLVQAEGDWKACVAVLHCEPAWYYVCGILVCWLNG